MIWMRSTRSIGESRRSVGPLEVKAWGRHEFHMVEPAGVCFQFYQRTA